ncbi:malectin-A-like [Diadema antillarum]|uniref:malectin-A-like n=1 Tax=Diadema antillarum TaxID=105358 RepID=UPI003A89303A
MKLMKHISNVMLVTVWFLMHEITKCAGIGEVIFAVNSGGPGHVDMYGTRYEEDPLTIGIASDYGKNMPIARVPPSDAILYQTERYHLSTFGYDVPIEEDGDYVLVLKFCEVWFTAPKMKVFDVVLNEQHTVVPGLDIYHKVGRGTAHDEVISFTVSKSKLRVQDEVSTFGGNLRVEFQKGELDNPKVNAIVVYKGSVDDVPRLPAIPGLDDVDEEPEEDDEDKDEEDVAKPAKQTRWKSGPKAVDPYAADETSFLFPVLITIAIFIPTLFCLCRL